MTIRGANLLKTWCERGDSNPHGCLAHQIENLVHLGGSDNLRERPPEKARLRGIAEGKSHQIAWTGR